MKAAIKDIAVYLPPDIVSNEMMEQKIVYNGAAPEAGFLGKLLGGAHRHFAGASVQVSDLACEAARKVLDANPGITIDLLIFAAASSDLTEPATANIVQHKLALTCPVMDIKNACNSFVSAIHVASAFVEAGVYRNVLVAGGEKLNEVINWEPRDAAHFIRCISAYGLGDGGAAMLIGESDERKLVYQKFCSWGEYWDFCTVKGGGSLAYRDLDQFYFEGDARAMRDVFLRHGAAFIAACLQESVWQIADIDRVISHQVAAGTTSLVAGQTGIPEHKFINTFGKYGNTAAVTIPLALHEALSNGQVKKGDKLMLLGLAAGISVSVQLIEW